MQAPNSDVVSLSRYASLGCVQTKRLERRWKTRLRCSLIGGVKSIPRYLDVTTMTCRGHIPDVQDGRLPWLLRILRALARARSALSG